MSERWAQLDPPVKNDEVPNINCKFRPEQFFGCYHLTRYGGRCSVCWAHRTTIEKQRKERIVCDHRWTTIIEAPARNPYCYKCGTSKILLTSFIQKRESCTEE